MGVIPSGTTEAAVGRNFRGWPETHAGEHSPWQHRRRDFKTPFGAPRSFRRGRFMLLFAYPGNARNSVRHRRARSRPLDSATLLLYSHVRWGISEMGRPMWPM